MTSRAYSGVIAICRGHAGGFLFPVRLAPPFEARVCVLRTLHSVELIFRCILDVLCAMYAIDIRKTLVLPDVRMYLHATAEAAPHAA